MADIAPARLWSRRILYVVIALLVIFFQLLPLQTTPGRWAAPDVLVAITLAWAARRPEYVPSVLIAVVMLTADFMLQRPPGLWAALVLVAAELLRPSERGTDTSTFTVEWLRFGGYVIAITLAYRVVLLILLADPGPLGLAITQALGTILIYPLVVLVSWALLGLRRTTPGDMERVGYRI